MSEDKKASPREVTEKWISQFKSQLVEHEGHKPSEEATSAYRLWLVEKNSIISQIEDLQAQLERMEP